MIDNRRATVLVATPADSSVVPSNWTTPLLVRPVRWAVMNPSTSLASIFAGSFVTTVKNTRRS